MPQLDIKASIRELSSYNASIIRNANNNKRLENQRNNIEDEEIPIYNLINIDFNTISRKVKVFLNCSQKYRTVERYVQRNYVKYPVYSAWKIKNKSIVKSIKLTNENIEKLNVHEDELIRLFADEIICSLKNDDLLPSWFLKNTLEKYFTESNNKEIQLRNSTKTAYIDGLKNENASLRKIEIRIAKITNKKQKNAKKIFKLTQRILKNKSNKKSIIFGILTIGIYYFFKSNKYANILDKRLNKLTTISETIKIELEKTISEKKDEELKINSLNENEENSVIIYKKHIKEFMDIYSEKLRSIIPLSEECINFTNFIPLKSFEGYKYKKIIGCYVILNNELNKCYVGQSKDIMRRLKQHFNGTVPNNIIFAKDYFNSKLETKDDLFSVKIIPLKTKDQLDDNEKALIDQYDSYDSGYNSTSGNI